MGFLDANGVTIMAEYIMKHKLKTVNGQPIFGSTGGNVSIDNIMGNFTVGGKITVDGHSSAIGTVINGTRSSSAGTVGTSYSTVATIALPAGTWLITAFNSFNGGTAGVRRVLITSSSTATTDAATGSSSSYAAANNQIVVQSSLIVQPTATSTTYYMRCKSGSQVDSPYGNMTAVRIA